MLRRLGFDAEAALPVDAAFFFEAPLRVVAVLAVDEALAVCSSCSDSVVTVFVAKLILLQVPAGSAVAYGRTSSKGKSSTIWS